MRKAIVAGALALGLVGSGAGALTSQAGAASAPTYSTTQRVETVHGTCIATWQQTKSYYSWSSKTHSYVKRAAPRTTTTTSTTCHK